MRRLHGVVYPTPAPPADGPSYDPPPDPDDELALARNYVRTRFDPPLPDTFADWLITLHRHLRDGLHPDARVPVPTGITDAGFTFTDALTGGEFAPGQASLTLAQALRVFARDDLLFRDEPADRPGAVRPPRGGVTTLVAALMARGIRTTTTLHRNESSCTVALTDEQAGDLAALLLPDEGSTEDDLAIALELLDHFVHKPHPTACALDHHGHCQEHHDDMGDGRFAQHEAYDLLVRRNIREQA